MKIIFLDAGTTNFGDVNFSELMSLGQLILYDYTDANQVTERAAEAEVLIVNKFKINEWVIEQCPRLKYIVVAATGYNNITIQAVKDKNIPVSNVRSYSTTSVTQQLFSSLLSVLNHSEYYFNEVKNNRWNITQDFCFYDHSIEELADKTMGIAGFGDIGKKVALIAEAFDMNVSILKHKNQSGGHKYQYVDWETMLNQSDVISLHLPLTDQTKHFINAESLGKMKQHVILINTGRGGLINEVDLASHLKSHPGSKAILDVLNEEPPKSGNPLMELPNCFITPHIAWASKQARQRLINGMADNIKAFMNGNWQNRVYQL